MPIGFQVGPFFIRFYGIIVMLGAAMGALLAEREAKRRNLNTDMVWDSFFWLLIGGIVGARLWHIFTPSESLVAQGITTQYYLTHPLEAIDLRNGGLGIPGAVIGGLLALYIYTRIKKQSFGVWTDITAPALALGQAIGRWGNFINQELYGRPTDLPWGIYIKPQNRLSGFSEYTRFHPLFLYESIWNLANMALLLWLARRYEDVLKPGDLFLVYLIVYPLGRFFLEFLRLDVPHIGSLDTNQMFMAVVVVAATLALFLRHRKTA